MTGAIDFSELFQQNRFEVLFLTFMRLSAVIFLLPGISASYVPTQYKLCFAIVMSVTIYPIMQIQTARLDDSFQSIWVLALKEVITGLLIGLTIRVGVFALQISGTIIAQSSSIAQIFGGSVSNDAQSTVSNILTISGIALLMASGFLDQFAAFMLQSYDWQPLNMAISPVNFLNALRWSITEGYALAFRIATPFLALSLFYNITLGTVNRAMPQLLVSFVGAPGIIAASIGLLAISLQPMLQVWLDATIEISRMFWMR